MLINLNDKFSVNMSISVHNSQPDGDEDVEQHSFKALVTYISIS